MIIIVEGIDRVGKTTLCKKLNEQTNIPIYKHKRQNYSEMKNDIETDIMLQLIDIYKLLGGSIIFDRFHWSDFTYGVLKRDYSVAAAYENCEKIESYLKDDAILIYVMPIDIERSSDEHGSNLIQYDSMMNLLAKYSALKIYECTFDTIDDVIKEVIDEYRL